MAQLNLNQILIFGGENLTTYKDLDSVYYLNVSEKSLTQGPTLPEKILPENPGYTLKSHASFYFLGGIEMIYRFNKFERTWHKLAFE